jgi:hypothetical protein
MAEVTMWIRFIYLKIWSSSPVLRNLFLPTAHQTLKMAHEGTPQNFAWREGVQNNTWAPEMRILCINSYVVLIKINK